MLSSIPPVSPAGSSSSVPDVWPVLGPSLGPATVSAAISTQKLPGRLEDNEILPTQELTGMEEVHPPSNTYLISKCVWSLLFITPRLSLLIFILVLPGHLPYVTKCHIITTNNIITNLLFKPQKSLRRNFTFQRII